MPSVHHYNSKQESINSRQELQQKSFPSPTKENLALWKWEGNSDSESDPGT